MRVIPASGNLGRREVDIQSAHKIAVVLSVRISLQMSARNQKEPLPSSLQDQSDPIPNPEPVSPSLDEPDPGVFHHDPADRRVPEKSEL